MPTMALHDIAMTLLLDCNIIPAGVGKIHTNRYYMYVPEIYVRTYMPIRIRIPCYMVRTRYLLVLGAPYAEL